MQRERALSVSIYARRGNRKFSGPLSLMRTFLKDLTTPSVVATYLIHNLTVAEEVSWVI